MKPEPRIMARWQFAAWVGLIGTCGVLLFHVIHLDDKVAFLFSQEGPPWIAAPLPNTARLIAQDRDAPPVHVFVRHFDWPEGETTAWLEGRALRSAQAELNGSPLLLSSLGEGWRSGFKAQLNPSLKPGRNTLRLSVSRAEGPALLQAKLKIGDQVIETDSAWEVTTPNGTSSPAWRAHDQSLHPEARFMPTPFEIAGQRAPWLVGLFFISAAVGFLAHQGKNPKKWRMNAPRSTLVIVVLLWLWVFLFKILAIPPAVGFDATAHLAYLDYLRTHLSLPAADYGFATYHPPIFYLLTASVASTSEWISESSQGGFALHLIPFLSGLATVGFTARVALKLWPEEALRPCLAIAAAGLIPMNLYMSAYVSNEPFQTAVISGCLALAALMLFSERVGLRSWILLSIGLGLAILTKFTSLLIAPIIAFFVALRLWWVDGRSPGHSALGLLGLLLGCITLGGWFYLRNFMLFGDPFIWNLDVPNAPTWWLRPGFHTEAWYLSFGEALTYPYFSGYASFWDGIYSTFWGDGLVGGMARLETRHGLWNDDFQTLVYPLALPASALMGFGYVRLAGFSFTEKEPGRKIFLSLVTSLLAVLAFSLLYISFQLPFYAQAKAFYILPGLLPLSLCLAEGLATALDWCRDQRRAWPSALFCGWLGTFTGVIALAYAL